MKRIFSIILIFVLLFSFCSFGVNAAPEEQKQIKILAIGNSFSNDAAKYIQSIAYSMGINVSVTSLFYGGCSIERHVEFYNSNARKYKFFVDGVNISPPELNTMREVFESADYDYVTIQQNSGKSSQFSSYWTTDKPWLVDLYKIIKKHEPQAEIMIHETWSYSELCATEGTAYTQTSYKNSLEMFKKIEEAYGMAADKLGIDKEKGIIPVGKAIQLAKDEYGYGDFYNDESLDRCANGALYEDSGSHLNTRGRYIAACVWIEKILGADCRKATFHSELLEDECKILRQIAREAVTGEVQNVVGSWRYVPEGRDTVKLVHYMGEVPANGVIEFPTKLGDMTVSRVDDTAFKYVNGVKKVILPNAAIKYDDGALKKSYAVEDNRDDSVLYPKKKKAKKDDSNGWVVPVVIVSVVALVAVAVLIILLKKKKRKT